MPGRLRTPPRYLIDAPGRYVRPRRPARNSRRTQTDAQAADKRAAGPDRIWRARPGPGLSGSGTAIILALSERPLDPGVVLGELL